MPGAAALAQGHELTLFNRGRHNVDLFPGVTKLRGDRDHDVGALRGHDFDAVIDTSGYRPEHLQTVATALAGGAGHYVFVSSISVYRAFPPGQHYDETAALHAGVEGYGAAEGARRVGHHGRHAGVHRARLSAPAVRLVALPAPAAHDRSQDSQRPSAAPGR